MDLLKSIRNFLTAANKQKRSIKEMKNYKLLTPGPLTTNA